MIDLIFAEIERRAKPSLIYDSLFQEQKSVIDSISRFRSILTPRRAAKSWTICALMIITCLKKEEARCLYLGLTRQSVKRIAWDIICKICDTHNIKYKANKIDLIIYIGKSTIELGGADGTVGYTERYLGASFDVVAIDEAGSFNPILLDYLIDTVISPTLIDKQGTLLLAGTPRPIETGRFYDVTTTHPERWECFGWDTSANPHMKEQWEKELLELIKLNPNIKDTAWFIREYLGKWCKDTSDLVYKFDPNLNLTDKVKTNNNFTYILGVDIGWEDACAFVVLGYTKHDKELYIFESFKKSQMLPNAIAQTIKQYTNQYQPITIVADAQNKTVIQEISTRYGINITPTEKQNKYDWIELFNVDFTLGKIKIVQNTNTEYIKEISNLPWKETNKKYGREEHPAFDNHLADAALYGFRYAYHYRAKPIIIKKEEDKMVEWAINQEKRKRNWRKYGL